MTATPCSRGVVHKWQLMLRCVQCGFQVLVPEAPVHTVDVTGQLTLAASRIVNLSDVPLCKCPEVK